MKIPSKIRIGGQDIIVSIVDSIENEETDEYMTKK